MLKTELCSFLFATSVLCMIACSNTDNATQDNINKSLSKTEAETYAQQLINEWKEKVRTDMEASYKNKEITIGDKTMRLAWTVFDEKPKDGYALYISLHGGGGISAEENDEQWYNQQWLYEPDNAVYLAPRAISDTWDLHFLPETDAFYHQIIMLMTVFQDVNPDKVYLMGYSAGGDGVWRLAPRLADKPLVAQIATLPITIEKPNPGTYRLHFESNWKGLKERDVVIKLEESSETAIGS